VAQLLLSFCFTSPAGYVLGRLELETQHFEWVDLSAIGDAAVYGATGICRAARGFYVLLQIEHGSILVELDAAYRLRRAARLPGVIDPHSMVSWQDRLLAVSTGTNQVFAIDWPLDRDPVVTVFFEQEPGADTLHMNSLQVFEDQVYLSMFGHKEALGASWRTATNGKVLNLTDGGTLVVDGLHHPHGLCVDRGELLCLVSMRGEVVRVKGGYGDERIALGGYVRGAASDADHLYVGVSIPRARSKSRGTQEAADPAIARIGEGCGLHVFDKRTRQVEWLDLSPFGSELYDVAVLDDAEPVRRTRMQAMQQRLQAVNAESNALFHLWGQLRSEHTQLVEMIEQAIDVERNYALAKRVLEQLLVDTPDCLEWHYQYGRCLRASGAQRHVYEPYLDTAQRELNRLLQTHGDRTG
jgi:hypothetical protein